MQPPYRSSVMHCSTLDSLQICLSFATVLPNTTPAEEFFLHPHEIVGEPTQTKWTLSVQQTGDVDQELGDRIFRTEGNPSSAPSYQHIAKKTPFGHAPYSPFSTVQVWDNEKKQRELTYVLQMETLRNRILPPRKSRRHNYNSKAGRWLTATGGPPQEQWE